MFSIDESSTDHLFLTLSWIINNDPSLFFWSIVVSLYLWLEYSSGLNSHILYSFLDYTPVSSHVWRPRYTLILLMIFFSICSGWPSGSHLGYPANASRHWGPYLGLYSRGRNQQCTVGINSARLDSYLLQQLPGDFESVTLLLHATLRQGCIISPPL